jgi:hypothetical protein
MTSGTSLLILDISIWRVFTAFDFDVSKELDAVSNLCLSHPVPGAHVD